MTASQVREGRDKRVGTAFLSFSYHLVDAAVQYTRFAILRLSAYSFLTQVYYLWGGAALFFWPQKDKKSAEHQVLLNYLSQCIHRKILGDNYCGLSLRVTDFCVSVQESKDGRREKNIPCGSSNTDSHFLSVRVKDS